MEYKIISLLVSFYFYKCQGLLVDVSKTILIQGPHRDVHFGFSVHLQGKPGINHVIVGAPKRRNNFGKLTGSVYRCTVEAGGFCKEYDLKRTNDVINPAGNGELLGSKIVGDSAYGGRFFTCAPRLMSVYDRKNHFMKGTCYQMLNSTDVRGKAVVIAPSQGIKVTNVVYKSPPRTYYESAFGEVGFDLHYFKDANELITGAPGMTDWSGTMFTTNLNSGKSQSLPARLTPTENYSYFGYSVSVGKFLNGSEEVWYVAGMPRASNLKGQVVLFKSSPTSLERIQVKKEFLGREFGSYFGYSVLVLDGIISGRGDDIIVGAPMSREKSWDEGAIYYYRNLGNSEFEEPKKFIGSSPGSRFGTTMANLGDLRLDSSNFVAVSAPYENNGNGAVHLFVDETAGEGNYKFFNKLTSSRDGIRGFGMSISNPLDLDGNIHKDFAVGTYGSDCVVILHTAAVFDFQFELASHREPLNITVKKLPLDFHVTLTWRNKKRYIRDVSLKLSTLDDRIVDRTSVNKTISMESDVEYNFSHTVELKHLFTDLNPLELTLCAGIVTNNDTEDICKEFQIPFASECGHDKICNPDLSVNATIMNKDKEVILGQTQQVEVAIAVANKGEPAFRIEIFVTAYPPEVTITNKFIMNDCDWVNSSYRCVLSERHLILQTQTTFQLNVAELAPNTDSVEIRVRVQSLGVDKNASDNQVTILLPVITQTNAFMESKSAPETVANLDESGNSRTEIYFTHTFDLVNVGPSPFNLNVRLLIPQILLNGDRNSFEIESVEGIVKDTLTSCERQTTITDDGAVQLSAMSNSSNSNTDRRDENESIRLSCLDDLENCVEFVCNRGGYLAKSSQSAKFVIRIKVLSEMVSENFPNISSSQIDRISFATIAILNINNNNGRDDKNKILTCTAVTVMHGLLRKHAIPLWIYILSSIFGVLILSLLIVVMYVCNFFKRAYKDKMNLEIEEQLIPLQEPSDYADIFHDLPSNLDESVEI